MVNTRKLLIQSTASKKSRPSSDPIAEAARRHFTIPYLYPIQRYVISNILEQKNQIVILPTGAGKSLCYQLPARLGGGLILVVVPLLSLLIDQLRRCQETGLRAASLRGGQDSEERDRVFGQLSDGKVDLLFTTPETLESRTCSKCPARRSSPAFKSKHRA